MRQQHQIVSETGDPFFGVDICDPPQIQNILSRVYEVLLDEAPDRKKESAAPTANGNGGVINMEAIQLQVRNYQTSVSVPSDLDDLLGDMSALDMPIAVTRFPTQSAQKKTERQMSLRQLAATIVNDEANDKSELPFWKLATFGNHRTDKNCLRNNANVKTVTGVEADYDAGTITLDEAVSRLQKASIAALIYTTPSHCEPGKGHRWRVFAPFDAALSPADRDHHMMRLNGVFNGELDTASFALSQSYYAGTVRGKAPINVRLVDGRPINLASDLDAFALPKGVRRTDGAAAKAIDTSGSGALWTLACSIKRERGTFAEFSAAVPDRAEASAHLAREEQAGKGRRQRALERAWARAPEPTTVDDLFEESELDPKATRLSRLTFLSPGECADAPSRGYLLKGLLAPRDIACIFGAPGAGKSLIAPYLGYCIARGDPAFEMRAKAGSVFYVAAEDAHGMRGRVSALKMTHGDAEDFTLVEGVSDLLANGSEDLRALCEAVAERKPALIIIDTLAMAFPGLEENSGEGMGRVVAVAHRLTKHGAAVVLIHHDTKAEGGTPRGHSSLNGALDVAIQVSRDDQGVVRGKLTKNRNGSCERDIAFRIGVVKMGEDEDGDPITFGIAQEIAAGSVPKGEKLARAERAAFEILRDMSGTMRNMSQGVREDELRAACIESRSLCSSDNPESRRKAVLRAMQGLVRKRWADYRTGCYHLSHVHGGQLNVDAMFDEGGEDDLA